MITDGKQQQQQLWWWYFHQMPKWKKSFYSKTKETIENPIWIKWFHVKHNKNPHFNQFVSEYKAVLEESNNRHITRGSHMFRRLLQITNASNWLLYWNYIWGKIKINLLIKSFFFLFFPSCLSLFILLNSIKLYSCCMVDYIKRDKRHL